MTSLLQWSSIVGAGVLLAAYGFYRDRRDVLRERERRLEAEEISPQQFLFAQKDREHDRAWTKAL